MEYRYNDGMKPGRIKPRLYLAKGTQVEKFRGQAILGMCRILSQSYTKNGKWSCTDYVLGLDKGVKPLYFCSPLHQTWGDTAQSWGEVASDLGLPIEMVKGIIRAEYPSTAKRLDSLESYIETEEDAEVVIISFGSPTNREIYNGWWEAPKSGTTSDGREVVIRPGENGWFTPELVSPEGKIISSRHTPGIHGGYWAVEVAIP